MRYVYLLLTILCQFVVLHFLEDKYIAIIAIYMLCAIVGVGIWFSEANKKAHDFGWGLLFGTLTAAVMLVGLFLYVASHFRH